MTRRNRSRRACSVRNSFLARLGFFLLLWVALSLHLGSRLRRLNDQQQQQDKRFDRQNDNQPISSKESQLATHSPRSRHSEVVKAKTLRKPRMSASHSLERYSCRAGEETLTFAQAPDFILAGAQKSGTTALFALLEKHPSIVRSSNFEEHFFDMHYGIELESLEIKYPNETTESLHCRLGRLYANRLDFEKEILSKPESTLHQQNATRLLTFEKTPFYLVWPHIPRAIVRTCPWRPKIVVMLRNPVDRLYSHYQMRFVMRPNHANSLESVLDTELELLHKFGLSQAPLLSGNNTDALVGHSSNSATVPEQFRPPSIARSTQDRLDDIKFRGFGNHRQNQRFLVRGIYVSQLVRWLEQFDLGKELLVLQYEQFKKDPRRVYNQVLEFLGIDYGTNDSGAGFTLPEEVLTTIYRSEAEAEFLKTSSRAPPLKWTTKEYLQEFYRPYNEQLSRLLGNDPIWLWKDE